MVANSAFGRLSTLQLSVFQTALNAIPKFVIDHDELAAHTAVRYENEIRKTFVLAIYSASGTGDYLNLPKIRAWHTFVNDVGNAPTRDEWRDIENELALAKIQLQGAFTQEEKANATEALNEMKMNHDEEYFRYKKFKEGESLLASFLRFQTMAIEFYCRVMPAGIVLKLKPIIGDTTAMTDFINDWDAPALDFAELEDEQHAPGQQPWANFTKFARVLNAVELEVRVRNDMDLSELSHQINSRDVYKMPESARFMDWLHKLVLPSQEPLIGTEYALNVKRTMSRVLHLLVPCVRFQTIVQRLYVEFLPTVTELTTQVQIDSVYNQLKMVDDFHWSCNEKQPTEISINVAGFKKATQQDKVKAYTAPPAGKPKFEGTCFRCGMEGHRKGDCMVSQDKVDKRIAQGLVPNKPRPDYKPSTPKITVAATSTALPSALKRPATDGEKKSPHFPSSKKVSVSADIITIVDRVAAMSVATSASSSSSNASSAAASAFYEDWNAQQHTIDKKRKSVGPKFQSSRNVYVAEESSDDEELTTFAVGETEDKIYIDSAAMLHMFKMLLEAMDNIKPSSKQAVFGNGSRLEIQQEADLGPLEKIQICKGLTKELMSVNQIAQVNGMYSIFTELGCYVMKPSFNLKLKETDIAFFAPLENGLYGITHKKLYEGLNMSAAGTSNNKDATEQRMSLSVSAQKAAESDSDTV